MRKVKFDFSQFLWYTIYRIEGVYIMENENKYKDISESTFIDEKEFHSMIVDYIMSGEYKKYIASTTYADSKEFEMGFMFGMNWAALLTCECTPYWGWKTEEKENENENN